MISLRFSGRHHRLIGIYIAAHKAAIFPPASFSPMTIISTLKHLCPLPISLLVLLAVIQRGPLLYQRTIHVDETSSRSVVQNYSKGRTTPDVSYTALSLNTTITHPLLRPTPLPGRTLSWQPSAAVVANLLIHPLSTSNHCASSAASSSCK